MCKGHLSLEERQHIYVHHSMGKSYGEIGSDIGRDKSVVWREIKRNEAPVGIRDKLSNLEKATYAHDKSRRRRSDSKRGVKGPLKLASVRGRIEGQIRDCHYSPETIAKMLSQGDLCATVCGRTIRRWIVSDIPELKRELPQRGKPRRNKITKRGKKLKKAAPKKKSIHTRSEDTNRRKIFGDYEADAIVSKKSKAAIISVCERKSRKRWFRKVKNLEAATVIAALISVFRDIPPPLLKSCTFDNGGEFAEFSKLEMLFDLASFFCDPYAAWQKGQVERQNMEFRRFYPKGSDLSEVSEEELERIEEILNVAPMECLGDLSANNVWIQALGEARMQLH